MGKYNGKDATVWLRSIRDHTYEGKPQPEGSIYLAHDELVETIVDALKFAVREPSPMKAQREAPAPEAPAPVAPVPPPAATPATPVAPMTTASAPDLLTRGRAKLPRER